MFRFTTEQQPSVPGAEPFGRFLRQLPEVLYPELRGLIILRSTKPKVSRALHPGCGTEYRTHFDYKRGSGGYFHQG